MAKTVLCLTLLLIFSFIVHDGVHLKSLCGDDDWIAYEDEKCVKLFQSYETRHRAEGVYGNNIWIGAERRLDSYTEFDWNDGTPVQRFTNWAVGRPSDDVRRPCVYMQSPLSRNVSEMAWVDAGCTSGYWFICEKLQFWPIERFQQVILNTRRDLQYSVDSFTTLTEDMRNTLNVQGTQLQALQANPVPIGFIYVQLPNQPEPRTIWGTVGWTEITSEYAGLFFRAEGGNSATFGSIQAESSPRLHSANIVANQDNLSMSAFVFANGLQSSPVWIGNAPTTTNNNWSLAFTVSTAENRPRNQAMRIWRRTL